MLPPQTPQDGARFALSQSRRWRLLRPAVAGLSVVRITALPYTFGGALCFLFTDAEDAFAVIFCDLPILMLGFQIVVVFVQRFLFGIERRPFRFERCDGRKFFQPQAVKIILCGTVQNDVGGIVTGVEKIVTVFLRFLAAVQPVNLPRFSIMPDLFLKLRNLFLPCFNFSNPFRFDVVIGSHGSGLLHEFIVAVDAVFFKINQRPSHLLEVIKSRPVLIRFAFTLGKGFVPADIQSNYTNVITRQEFCRMAVKWVEYATGKSIDAVLSERGLSRDPNAFSDTNDPDILAAFALGITSGTGGGRFTPDGQFSREQAATMIMNTCKVVGANVLNPPTSNFTDLNVASSWAVDGINFVRANGIMQGTVTDPPTFSPKTNYTREQSIITFNNITHNDL